MLPLLAVFSVILGSGVPPPIGAGSPVIPTPGDAYWEPPDQDEVPEYEEQGDLPALKERGELRVLVPLNLDGGGFLPRQGSPVAYQQEYAEGFARSLGLRPVVIGVDGFKKLIPLLVEGKGDLIAANLTVTEQRRQQIAFSLPLDHVHEQVVVAAGEDEMDDVADLEGRTVIVDPATSFWETLLDKVSGQPGIQVLASELGDEEMLDLVAGGTVDAMIRDSNVVQSYLAYRDDIRVAFDLSGSRPVAWGVRRNAPKLRAELDRYLTRMQLTRPHTPVHRDDLAGIRERKVLRVLLRNNLASYFLWRGELLGFEYELAREFAKSQGLRLEVIVPPSHDLMLPWLLEGRGDIAAGFLRPSEGRRALGVAFSRPYHYAEEVVVARTDENGLSETRDLEGRTIVVRRTSSYWETIQDLQEQGIGVRLTAAPEDMETEEIIARVAAGDYDLTVADSQILAVELAAGQQVAAAFSLGRPVPHGWALRPQNTGLAEAVNQFFDEQYKGTFYNIIYDKYFTDPRRIKTHLAARLGGDGNGRLSDYDDLARKYAEQYGFDWRLIVAQMYQESRFDPSVHSWSGARGLMQVMPRTARHLGFEDLDDPETNLHAGVKYLHWVRERFDRDLPVADRMWFSLAAYNAGLGHVEDARNLAHRRGLDKDRWFDNVEKAMLMLSKRDFAKKARHGYVRGSEPVKYVRSIRSRYRAYVRLTEPEAPLVAGAEPAGLPAVERVGSSESDLSQVAGAAVTP